jgi:hypothetical protein
MQKANTQLHNSADKDKIKEPRTQPVPVPKPEKVEKIREADKKFFERLKKLSSSVVVGVLLTYLWLYLPLTTQEGALRELSGCAEPTPPLLTQAKRGDQYLAATDTPEAGGVVQDRGDKSGINNKLTAPHSKNDLDFTRELAIEEKKNIVALLPHSGDRIPVETPLDLLLKLLKDHSAGFEQTEWIDVLSKLESNPIDVSTIYQIVQKNRKDIQKLTLITFEIKECRESSSKALYTLNPLHTARIQLIVRGIDAESGNVLFEKTIDKERVEEDWAKFPIQEATHEAELKYKPSAAMQALLVESATEIIDLLHKYLL